MKNRGAAIVTGASLIGGIILGLVGFLIGKIVTPLLAVPILIGIGGGVFLKLIQKKVLVSTLFIGTAAVCLSVTSYGTYNYAKYHDYKQNLAKSILSERAPEFLSDMINKVTVPLIDDVIKLKTGKSGFAGYLIYTAEEPIPAGFGKVLDFGPLFAWALRITELLLIISLTISAVVIRKKA